MTCEVVEVHTDDLSRERFKILQKIIGHPEHLPTLKELDYFMLDVNSSTIRNHLETLVDTSLVARVTLPEDQRTRDNPHVFYCLPKRGEQRWKTRTY
ncbi:putative transcriptional regulator [Natronococcus amylolyticus DSM 10524]|uniref:Putative transcriptional regulator n=1 Tax=Natronococcus amylolyticus DSM 10524 TaxID=1227497 RepID=L9X454_9EURY|nr:putative transcriptional regulator [Natronococcus amylolyticus DSM 10524]